MLFNYLYNVISKVSILKLRKDYIHFFFIFAYKTIGLPIVEKVLSDAEEIRVKLHINQTNKCVIFHSALCYLTMVVVNN